MYFECTLIASFIQGDLVQLKEVSIGSSNELKSKAMDHLVMTHGLRHENVNPLIGTRTARILYRSRNLKNNPFKQVGLVILTEMLWYLNIAHEDLCKTYL